MAAQTSQRRRHDPPWTEAKPRGLPRPGRRRWGLQHASSPRRCLPWAKTLCDGARAAVTHVYGVIASPPDHAL